MTEKTIGAGILAGMLPNVCSILIYAVVTIDEVWQFCLVHIVVIVLVAILMRSADKELFTIKTRIAVIIYSVIAIYNFLLGMDTSSGCFTPSTITNINSVPEAVSRSCTYLCLCVLLFSLLVLL